MLIFKNLSKRICQTPQNVSVSPLDAIGEDWQLR